MLRICGIIYHPTAITADDLEMVIPSAIRSNECSVVLSASAKVTSVAL